MYSSVLDPDFAVMAIKVISLLNIKKVELQSGVQIVCMIMLECVWGVNKVFLSDTNESNIKNPHYYRTGKI